MVARLIVSFLILGCTSEVAPPTPFEEGTGQDASSAPETAGSDAPVPASDATEPQDADSDRAIADADPDHDGAPTDEGADAIDAATEDTEDPSDPPDVPDAVDTAASPFETVPAGACGQAVPIACAQTFSGHTGEQATGQVLDGTACNEFIYPNTEVVFVFEAPAAGIIDVAFDPGGAALDLMLLPGSSGGCDDTKCISWGPSEGVKAKVKSGEFVYLVVDGYLGASGAFELSVGCTGLRP